MATMESGIAVPGLDPSNAPEAIVQAALDRALPVRIKVQPDLYKYGGPSSNGIYLPWRGISWKIEAQSAEEVEQVRQVYELLHGAIAAGKIRQAIGKLSALQASE